MKRIRIIDIAERLRVRRIVTSEGCWLWTGTKNNDGYGMTGARMELVHRVSYELHIGPVPAGLVLDHLCRNRACFNPEHLEPVTQRENTLRSAATLGAKNAAKTECPQGHPYDEANTYVYRSKSPRQCTMRICRACARERARKRAAAKRAVTK